MSKAAKSSGSFAPSAMSSDRLPSRQRRDHRYASLPPKARLEPTAFVAACLPKLPGRGWALDARVLKRHQQTFGYLYQSALRAEVRRIVDAMAEGGGYILAPTNHLQPDVPVENIVEVYRYAQEYSCSAGG